MFLFKIFNLTLNFNFKINYKIYMFLNTMGFFWKFLNKFQTQRNIYLFYFKNDFSPFQIRNKNYKTTIFLIINFEL